MIEAKELDKMIKSDRIFVLDKDRNTSARLPNIIIGVLSHTAMTISEIAKKTNKNVHPIGVKVRKLERQGLLEAFSDGKDIYYMKKRTTNEY